MRPLLIKVCGMTEPQNLLALDALGADYAGLIFYPPSKRYVEKVLLPENLPQLQHARYTGVFVDTGLAEIRKQVSAYRLEAVQVHRLGGPELCRALKAGGLTVMQVFSVGEKLDQEALTPYHGVVDYFLFDTAGPLHGGNGTAFSWDLLASYTGPTPFFLSGGIGPEHVPALRSFKHPQWAGIDLNSRFEVRPGLKNMPLLADFLTELSLDFEFHFSKK